MAPSASNSAPAKQSGSGAVSSYHAASTQQAIEQEHEFAAHNYHPLPMVFARAQGTKVWDPEVSITVRPLLPSTR